MWAPSGPASPSRAVGRDRVLAPLPILRDLGTDEIREILTRNSVGRIAYSWHDRVDIEPVHYVYVDEMLYGRTSEGTKMEVLRHNWSVAFEVDEVDDLLDWRSVVVHGGFYRLYPGGPAQARMRHQVAVDAIRTLVPEAFGPDDPTPSRSIVFEIPVQEIHGRAAVWKKRA